MQQAVPQCLDYVMGEGIALHALDPLPEPLGLVVEVVEDDFLQAEPAQLSYGVELGCVEGDVGDEWKGGVALEESGHRADVHDPVSGRVEDHDADGLAADEGLELLPR